MPTTGSKCGKPGQNKLAIVKAQKATNQKTTILLQADDDDMCLMSLILLKIHNKCHNNKTDKNTKCNLYLQKFKRLFTFLLSYMYI